MTTTTNYLSLLHERSNTVKLNKRDVEDFIYEVIQEDYTSEKVKSKDRLKEDLKLDDLDIEEIIMAIEYKFKISIDESNMNNVKTVADLIDLAMNNNGTFNDKYFRLKKQKFMRMKKR